MPRSLEEIERLATHKAVVYRLAIIEALRELDWRSCPSCRRVRTLLEAVDDPPAVPEPRDSGEPTPLTAFDVSCLFDVDPKTIHAWVDSGKIPAYYDEQNRLRFDPYVIDALL